jgi:transketolase
MTVPVTETAPEWREDVVARGHGDHPPIPPGIERDMIDTMRFLAADAVEHAGSGHPGTAMALAPLAARLHTRWLRHDPADPGWIDRDRFVLSAGHASILQYAALHLSGYDLSLDDLRSFRRRGSRTPGHPERGHTPGVEVTTGPLGQGISMAVGLAMAERMLAARFNRPDHAIVDHRTWVIAGDGDLMEGVSGEAASLAGTLSLDRLTVFYDDNHISIEGSTDLAFCEHVAQRYRAYGWHVLRVDDVNDLAGLDAAVEQARAQTERPTLVVVGSHIGYGSPKQDDAAAHGSPLGADALASAREALGWRHGPFEVPGEVYASWRQQVAQRAQAQSRWRQRYVAYRDAHPALAAELDRRMAGRLPDGWQDHLPSFGVGKEAAAATRSRSGEVINALAPAVPELVGGSADLAPSTTTTIDGAGDIAAGAWDGRNIHFGVREHAMGAVLNGLAAHGGFRPFGATFLVFSDYLRPALRLSALMRLPVVYVFTHDSVGMGEDGPTHQPIEHLAGLRATPGLTVLRPADGNETAAAWRAALEAGGPSALILSRQGLPSLPTDRVDVAGAVMADGGDATILATGSEVHVALAARELLAERGVAVRVVSLPSWERFRQRPAAERDALVPADRPRISVAAGASQGWQEFADVVVGVDRFGLSAAGPEALDEVGITPEAVTDAVDRMLAR